MCLCEAAARRAARRRRRGGRGASRGGARDAVASAAADPSRSRSISVSRVTSKKTFDIESSAADPTATWMSRRTCPSACCSRGGREASGRATACSIVGAGRPGGRGRGRARRRHQDRDRPPHPGARSRVGAATRRLAARDPSFPARPSRRILRDVRFAACSRRRRRPDGRRHRAGPRRIGPPSLAPRRVPRCGGERARVHAAKPREARREGRRGPRSVYSSGSRSSADLVAADLMIEAVIEDADVKKDLFRRADEAASSGGDLSLRTRRRSRSRRWRRPRAGRHR